MPEVLLFQATHCPACERPYAYPYVHLGWVPCRCEGARDGGHIGARCERDGCGHHYLEDHVGPVPEPGVMPPLGRP